MRVASGPGARWEGRACREHRRCKGGCAPSWQKSLLDTQASKVSAVDGKSCGRRKGVGGAPGSSAQQVTRTPPGDARIGGDARRAESSTVACSQAYLEVLFQYHIVPEQQCVARGAGARLCWPAAWRVGCGRVGVSRRGSACSQPDQGAGHGAVVHDSAVDLARNCARRTAWVCAPRRSSAQHTLPLAPHAPCGAPHGRLGSRMRRVCAPLPAFMAGCRPAPRAPPFFPRSSPRAATAAKTRASGSNRHISLL